MSGFGPLRIEYDESIDLLKVDGIRYAGTLFRGFCNLPIGTLMRIEKREDGVITVRSYASGESVIA